jgi:N-acetylglucosaminyl-diphospho-decaprenol L-rhamnosyltransferase
VVLNYRTPDLTIECVESALRALDPHRDTVVVVDNASDDASAQKIRSAANARGWESRVQVVESPANGGFSAGHNQGIRAIDAKAYFLLNSDTIVHPGAVDHLLSALEADPAVGLVSPRLEWPDGTPQISCFRFHTPWSELIAGSGTGPIRRLLHRYDVPLPVCENPFDPDWTSFAAVLLRRETIDRVGLLDERFFMYYEDADYCRRAWSHGLRVRHVPQARVIHLRGGTSPVKALTAARRRRPRYYYASRRRFFRQAYGWPGLAAANLLWTVGRALSWLRETIGSKPPHTVERELRDIWRG